MNEDLRDIPVPDEPSEIVAQYNDRTKQPLLRRAYIYREIEDKGHPSLIDTAKLADELAVSRRQIYGDLEAIRDFIADNLGDRHIAENVSIFQKAKREAIRNGEYDKAVKIVKEEAEWLEDRGAIETEPEKHELSWRDYLEAADEEEPIEVESTVEGTLAE